MSQEISDTFGEQLRQMRSDLLSRIRAQRGGKIGRAEAAASSREQVRDDGSEIDAERDMAIALEEREAAELTQIDDALGRIAAGTYGLCLDCGVSIPTARLHANPMALRCVACQDKQEHARGGEAHPTL